MQQEVIIRQKHQYAFIITITVATLGFGLVIYSKPEATTGSTWLAAALENHPMAKRTIEQGQPQTGKGSGGAYRGIGGGQ